MHKKQILILILVFNWLATTIANNDTISSGKSFFLIPHIAYQQETNWSAGIAYGYYFNSKDISRISSISGSATYTLQNQFLFNITPKLYFADKKWFVYANLNFRNYPDYYYGIGNKPTHLKIAYTSQNFNFNIQPQYQLSEKLYIGALVALKTEKIHSDSSLSIIEQEIYNQFGSDGWTNYKQYFVGLIGNYDSRDNQFYPSKGVFIKAISSFSPQISFNSYALFDYSIDFRKYFSLPKNQVLAFQTYTSGMFGKSGIPFQLLPTLGGRDVMRGYRQGMYRDNILITAQTEYRFPIYKRLKAALFCSAGDVMNSSDMKVDKLKVAYGAGLRYRLNDARVHLRFDIAKNNYGEKLQFYITATEAF